MAKSTEDKIATRTANYERNLAALEALPAGSDEKARRQARNRVYWSRSEVIRAGGDPPPLPGAKPRPRSIASARAAYDRKLAEWRALKPDADPVTREKVAAQLRAARSKLDKAVADDPPDPPEPEPPQVPHAKGKRPSPPEQLRARLEVARAKRTPFRVAFRHALRHIDYPTEWESAKGWKAALKETAEEWEAAYVGAPPVVAGIATIAEGMAIAA